MVIIVNNLLSNITVFNTTSFKLELLDSHGALFQIIEIHPNKICIDLSKINSGNYSIKLETEFQTILKSIKIS
jgi:hypothetical protein